MQTIVKKLYKERDFKAFIYIVNDYNQLPASQFSIEEVEYVKNQQTNLEKEMILLPKLEILKIVQFFKNEGDSFKIKENCRKSGERITVLLNENKVDTVLIKDLCENKFAAYSLAEGMALGNYQFIKYKTEQKTNALQEIIIDSAYINNLQYEHLNILTDAVYACRDMVNEPLTFLDAVSFSEIITKMAIDAGIKVDVFNKTKIESLKMGGLLAVNRGSIDPPTFSVMEWKPEGSINSKPYVFVGKGVVYDTGGVNIKPGESMLDMKCDMGGAAAVVCAIYAIASAKLPFHVVGLIPSTDNRPDGNAYVPGDVITMFTGKTVEIMNTDAEGRLILADALGYASKFNPELVIDLATLTGAASRAIGPYGIVAMHEKASDEFEKLKQCGENVYERLAEFPFWDEYGELIKSDVADIKNLGGSEAGMITAGKFLQEFTDYPFIHLDIAGPVFLSKKDSYRGKNATGVGVRLLFDFILNKIG
ncbi:MAG: leucyl aminopeptidase family protein [Bacteroidales bacterium]